MIYRFSEKYLNIYCTVEGYTKEWGEMYNDVAEKINIVEGFRPITTSEAAKLVENYMKNF